MPIFPVRPLPKLTEYLKRRIKLIADDPLVDLPSKFKRILWTCTGITFGRFRNLQSAGQICREELLPIVVRCLYYLSDDGHSYSQTELMSMGLGLGRIADETSIEPAMLAYAAMKMGLSPENLIGHLTKNSRSRRTVTTPVIGNNMNVEALIRVADEPPEEDIFVGEPPSDPPDDDDQDLDEDDFNDDDYEEEEPNSGDDNMDNPDPPTVNG
jgi:hypothetical protein